MVNVKERIDYLRGAVAKHDRLYEQNRPIISDGEYDKLMDELVQLEASYPEYADPTSPTQRIITVTVDGLQKRKHRFSLLSLLKIKTPAEVIKFAEQMNATVSGQPKLDGLTIHLTYDGGRLQEAVTRGDGVEGEVVTHTVRTIQNLPKRIPFKGLLEVRGECIITMEEFERINAAEGGKYSHPRNLASGTVRQLDAAVAAARGLMVLCYDLTYIEGYTFQTDEEQRNFLARQGFPLVPSINFPVGHGEFIATYCEWYGREERAKLPYLIDGLVLKVEDLAQRQELGNTSKAPRWAVAFKFPAQFHHTVLRNVVWQVNRTGIVAPVAVFDETDLDGADTTRATLHNADFIKNMGLHLGDTIVIARSNDVIPKVIGVVEDAERGKVPVEAPFCCPECGHGLEFEGAYLKCVNQECPAIFLGQVIHVASKDALDIEDFGESVAEMLVKEGFVRSLPDIFELREHADALMKIEGYGKKKVEKLLAAIDAAKAQPLNRVLYALSVPLLGRTVSKQLAEHFGHMTAIKNATKEQLVVLEGVGDAIATNVTEWFAQDENINLVWKLANAGLTMTAEKKERASDALAGKTVVITGTLSQSRSHFEELVEQHGGKKSGSVSKKTSYVLYGDEAGSKLDKAKELGVPIITEAEFLEMIG